MNNNFLQNNFLQNNFLQNNFLPWIEKYRPKNIDEIISHNQNITTIKKIIEGNALPHLLFYGASGTGKTSTIMAIVKELYGNNSRLMVMKLDASDERGINSVREEIKGFAEKSNMFINGIRLIILDEADSMTYDAQFALRRIIEKYSNLIRFCLICNYENKIIPAIRSRCANFRFNIIENQHIISKLNSIIKNENIEINNNILENIANISGGDLRKAINLLQSMCMKNKEITLELCYETAGIPLKNHINIIFTTLIDKNINFINSYNIINTIIKENSYSLNNIITEIVNIITNSYSYLDKYINIIIDLAELENMVIKSTFDNIYISGLIGIFRKKDLN